MCNTTIAKLASALRWVILAIFMALPVATVFAASDETPPAAYPFILARVAKVDKTLSPEKRDAYNKGRIALTTGKMVDEKSAGILEGEVAEAQKIADTGGPGSAYAKQDLPALRAAALALRSGKAPDIKLKSKSSGLLLRAIVRDDVFGTKDEHTEAALQAVICLEGGRATNLSFAKTQIAVAIDSIQTDLAAGLPDLKLRPGTTTYESAKKNAEEDLVAFKEALQALKAYVPEKGKVVRQPNSTQRERLLALGVEVPDEAGDEVAPSATPAPVVPQAQPTPTPPVTVPPPAPEPPASVTKSFTKSATPPEPPVAQPSPAAPAVPTVEKPATPPAAAPSVPAGAGSPVVPTPAAGGATGSNLPIGRTGLPVARWVPGKPGLVFALDGDPMHQNDVSGYAQGVIATCTFSGKKFEVPESPAAKVIKVSVPRPKS